MKSQTGLWSMGNYIRSHSYYILAKNLVVFYLCSNNLIEAGFKSNEGLYLTVDLSKWSDFVLCHGQCWPLLLRFAEGRGIKWSRKKWKMSSLSQKGTRASKVAHMIAVEKAVSLLKRLISTLKGCPRARPQTKVHSEVRAQLRVLRRGSQFHTSNPGECVLRISLQGTHSLLQLRPRKQSTCRTGIRTWQHCPRRTGFV